MVQDLSNPVNAREREQHLTHPLRYVRYVKEARHRWSMRLIVVNFFKLHYKMDQFLLLMHLNYCYEQVYQLRYKMDRSLYLMQ